MGNITWLARNDGIDTRDYLTLSYNGNQLKSVNDGFGSQNLYNLKEYNDRVSLTTEFFYDLNGNMTSDLDRDIVTIKYNLLNLPEIIQFKNGCQIINKYDAGGKKLSTRFITLEYTLQQPLNPGQLLAGVDVNPDENVTVEGTDYINNFEYKVQRHFDFEITDSPVDSRSLNTVYNNEGYSKRLFLASNQPIYSYYRKDHLGNTREVWTSAHISKSIRGIDRSPASTVQRTQYYPSGLPWASNSGDNPWIQNKKYNGKEFVEMHGLDEYDSEARWYYPAIMRTTTLDPLAEKYYSISPYAYCAGNPVNRIDPDGMDWEMSTKVENGVTTYLFAVNAVLYNNSGSDIDMDKLAQGISAQVMGAYNFKGDGFNVSMDFNLKVVNSVDEISETDHVFQVIDQSVFPIREDAKVSADTQHNSLNIRIGTELANDIVSGNNQRSAAHELGHTGGLFDTNINSKGVGRSPDNLMMQSIAVDNYRGNTSTAIKLNQYQIEYIYN